MAGILLCIIYFLFESFFCSDELDENEKLGEGTEGNYLKG